MRWHIFAIGKPKLAFAEIGVSEYAKRLSRFVKLEIAYGKAGTQEQESRWLLAKSDGMFRVALDEHGVRMTSREWASMLESMEIRGTKQFAILIGGANGHTTELRNGCDAIWSLSALTLQHELALLVLTEQLYRACSINAGFPYHRD